MMTKKYLNSSSAKYKHEIDSFYVTVKIHESMNEYKKKRIL